MVADLPAPLLRDLFRLDDRLLLERYNAALGAIGAPATARRHLHVDAAGFSPELAAELGDPLYLSRGALRAHALIVAVEQLEAPLVHPGLGFAADAYRRVTAAHRPEISRITLSPDVPSRAFAIRRQAIERLTQLMTQGQAAGELRTDVTAQHLASAFDSWYRSSAWNRSFATCTRSA